MKRGFITLKNMLVLRTKTETGWVLVRAPSLSEFSDTLHETADLVEGRVTLR